MAGWPWRSPAPAGHFRSKWPITFRAIEAAEVYLQGWAPKVRLFQGESEEADEATSSLGILRPHEQEYNQEVFERLGAPKAAIMGREPPTKNSGSEVRHIAEKLRRQGGETVILVTSPVHTRREKIIGQLTSGGNP
jgi:uncharacterized SAM-binding protein YcdF (DUF218 family)